VLFEVGGEHLGGQGLPDGVHAEHLQFVDLVTLDLLDRELHLLVVLRSLLLVPEINYEALLSWGLLRDGRLLLGGLELLEGARLQAGASLLRLLGRRIFLHETTLGWGVARASLFNLRAVETLVHVLLGWLCFHWLLFRRDLRL
jgi:hypothetical protein